MKNLKHPRRSETSYKVTSERFLETNASKGHLVKQSSENLNIIYCNIHLETNTKNVGLNNRGADKRRAKTICLH